MLFHLLFAAEVDPLPNRKSSKSGVERMLEFGRELFQMSQRLEKENGANETNRRMLEVSWNSHLVGAPRESDSNMIVALWIPGCI